MEIFLIVICVMLLVGGVNYYVKYQHLKLAFSVKTKTVEELQRNYAYLKKHSDNQNELLILFKKMMTTPMTAVSNGFIKRSYEVRSDGRVMNKAKLKSDSGENIRSTNTCKMYYKVEDKYLEDVNIHFLNLMFPEACIERIKTNLKSFKAFRRDRHDSL